MPYSIRWQSAVSYFFNRTRVIFHSSSNTDCSSSSRTSRHSPQFSHLYNSEKTVNFRIIYIESSSRSILHDLWRIAFACPFIFIIGTKSIEERQFSHFEKRLLVKYGSYLFNSAQVVVASPLLYLHLPFRGWRFTQALTLILDKFKVFGKKKGKSTLYSDLIATYYYHILINKVSILGSML